MHASWKIASSALFVLALAAGGCAAGGEEAEGDGATLAAQEADGTPAPRGPSGNISVSVSINQDGSNDHLGFPGHGHHGFGLGMHGHHGCHGQQPPASPTADAPPPPPPPPPAPAAQPEPTPSDPGQSGQPGPGAT